MSQKTILTITAKKLAFADRVAFDTTATPAIGAAQDITLGLQGDYVIYSVTGSNGTTDALIRTASGIQCQCAQEFADVNTALSATSSTNS